MCARLPGAAAAPAPRAKARLGPPLRLLRPRAAPALRAAFDNAPPSPARPPCPPARAPPRCHRSARAARTLLQSTACAPDDPARPCGPCCRSACKAEGYNCLNPFPKVPFCGVNGQGQVIYKLSIWKGARALRGACIGGACLRGGKSDGWERATRAGTAAPGTRGTACTAGWKKGAAREGAARTRAKAPSYACSCARANGAAAWLPRARADSGRADKRASK